MSSDAKARQSEGSDVCANVAQGMTSFAQGSANDVEASRRRGNVMQTGLYVLGVLCIDRNGFAQGFEALPWSFTDDENELLVNLWRMRRAHPGERFVKFTVATATQ